MLGAQPKNRRRRRRRRKHSIQASGKIASSSNLDVNESSPTIEIPKMNSFLPKVNDAFLNEDAEIETAILIKRFTKNNELEKTKNRAIEFFTSSIALNGQLKAVQENTDELQVKTEESMDVLPTPSSIRTDEPYPDDGPQLASSYFNEELDNVVEPFETVTIAYAEHEMFLPQLKLPKQIPIDIEAALIAVSRNPIDEGYYVKAKPNIFQVNRAQFVNRLIQENSLHWLDIDQKDIRGLFDFVQSKTLIKSDCMQKFHPEEYLLTTVHTAFNDATAAALQYKFLKIQINNIVFDQHPLFNAEQKIAIELQTLYDEYVTRKFSDTVASIETKLDVLRQLLSTVSKSNSLRSQRSSIRYSKIDNFIRIYRNELIDLRNRLHHERSADREIVKNILEKWAALKKERENRSSVTTTLKLKIKTQKSDVERDECELNYRFNLEFTEILKESMELYREQRRQQKLDLKKYQRDGPEIEVIQKIELPDAKKIQQQLYEIYSKSMRPPGEEIIYFELEKIEIANDHATGKNLPKYVTRLLLDDEELDFAETTRLNSIGQVFVNGIFSVKFTSKIPFKLKFQIYEKHTLNLEKKIAEIFIPIPHENESFQSTSMLYVSFASEPAKSYSGKIGCRLGWSADDQTITTPLSPISNQIDSIVSKTPETVDTWFSEQLIDPMDPENSALMRIIENPSNSINARISNGQKAPQMGVFRMNEDLYTFCGEQKLNDDKRIELLNARFNSDLKLKNCKLVPHNEIEIELPADLNIFEDMLWVDPIDVQRYQGKKYLKHVYDIITNHCEVINRNYVHQDLLIGDTPPTMYGALEALGNTFSPRRPLNPNRRCGLSARRSNFREENINRFNIIVNVVRASGIPFRNQSDQSVNRRSSLASTMQILHRQPDVRPFVTATFRDKTLRTSTVNGSSPTWNEQIVIPIHEDINQIKESLWFHMYDEIIEDLPSNANPIVPATEIYQKISSQYLGELLIPFSTIYASQRIEGTFEMSTPTILLGYTKPSVNFSEHGVANGTIEIRQSILISLLIVIEPIIEIENISTSHLECIELTRIKNHIQMWLNEVAEEFPHRAQDPLVSLANGKRVCITRLICAAEIPFERNETSEYLIRRFVSLIPVRPHKNVCTKLNGIWLTIEQILNILIVSPKDLGVLLTCYYVSLGFTAYLVMGFAIPYGDTTFVLTKENGENFLIDPHSGRKCSSRDTFCALTKVYCIANSTNVWANIQRENRVFMQNFDTKQTTEWRELFNKSMPAPTDSVHDLAFTYTDSLDCSNLQSSIEMKLMKKICAWRLDRKTVWNKCYRDVLQQILKDLEEDRCFGFDQKTYTEKLIEMTVGKYKVSGYPINMPYISIARIVERIKGTGIHLNTDAKVEFSLAVHIQSYPMNIFSVWVFLLALIPHS